MAESRNRKKVESKLSSTKRDDAKTTDKSTKKSTRRKLKMPKFVGLALGYFKNSWLELRATKWPKRGATWSLTLAVIVFSTLIMSFIVGIDYLFNMLFERLIT